MYVHVSNNVLILSSKNIRIFNDKILNYTIQTIHIKCQFEITKVGF